MKKVYEVKVGESYHKTFNVEAQNAKETEKGERSATFGNKREALKRGRALEFFFERRRVDADRRVAFKGPNRCGRRRP